VVPLERAQAPCPGAHEPAAESALFRAVLCLDLAISLRSEAASQCERFRYLARLGLP